MGVDEEREAWEAQHGSMTQEEQQEALAAQRLQHAQQAAAHFAHQQQPRRQSGGGRGKKGEAVPRGPPELEALEALLAEYDGLLIATEEADGEERPCAACRLLPAAAGSTAAPCYGTCGGSMAGL
jgi:hypothetical protein